MMKYSTTKSLVAIGCSLAFLNACSDNNQAANTSEAAMQSSSSQVTVADDMLSSQELSATAPANTLTEKEIQEGFVLLFDGETTKGWRAFNRGDFPPNWVVDDGTLHMVGESAMSEEQKAKRSDIVFNQAYSDFILKLDWKISENGNSGIFYLGSENQGDAEYDYIWKTAPEMQILDNQGHPDASKGKNGNRQAGSLYDLIPAVPQNAAPVGEWNTVEIHVEDRKVKHIQNGVVVVEYEMDTPEWEAMIATSKFPGLNPNWSQVPVSGLIGLQDHSDPVWFRNIKLKSL